MHETIQTIAGQPDLGIRRHFAAPELVNIRSFQIDPTALRPPFAFLLEGPNPAH
jgi:hypothetical protein